MKILLTNDDGVQATGLSVLRDIALEISDDVWICAPDSEQSAASRAVSLHNPLRLLQKDERVFSVTGTPTDSVILALSALMADAPPDLILSGVNRGQNMAEDVSFSGTVAAALQGMQMGIPSIALSLAKGFQGATSLPWETALAHGPTVIRDLLERGWPKDVVPNVNFPDRPADQVKGMKFTRQGVRDSQSLVLDKRSHPRGGDYFWMAYKPTLSDPAQGTDLRAIYEGYISVTPLYMDLTHRPSLEAWNGESG